MLAGKSEIRDMIPQAPPMVMVDGLVASDSESTVSRLALDKDNIFCQDGYFREPGLIENVAQTAALRAGYKARESGTDVKKGFIGAVKNFTIYQLPPDDAVLQTKVTIVSKLMNAMIIKGQVFSDDTLIAEGEMSIFEQ